MGDEEEVEEKEEEGEFNPDAEESENMEFQDEAWEDSDVGEHGYN